MEERDRGKLMGEMILQGSIHLEKKALLGPASVNKIFISSVEALHQAQGGREGPVGSSIKNNAQLSSGCKSSSPLCKLKARGS
jgi:hypothetical protein